MSSLGPDFRRLWGAYAISELGTTVGMGALPLIAVTVLDSSTFEVTLLAALAAIVSAMIALPAGGLIEFRRKRPVMIGADLVRFAVLASVPVAMVFGVLTYAHLCVVGVTQTACSIVFNAAGGAHLKALVTPDQRMAANSRFETTLWTMISVGPPLGGVLVSWFGAALTVGLDAVSFLLSALGIRRLRAPEPEPPKRVHKGHWAAELTAGWRYIFAHRGLHALFWNAMVFGGAMMLSTPLLAVLMLRELGFTPWEYGLALGIPGVGGVLGSLLARRLTLRFGQRGILLSFGVLRGLTLSALPFAAPGTAGLVVIVVSETALLFCAGVFNPAFTTYRMGVTVDGFMARVTGAWAVSSKSVQPMFIAAGGLLAAATSTRTALAVAAVAVFASAALLPWRRSAWDQRSAESAKSVTLSA
ncbi:MFS transporter [Phytomonospora sp. NPDC050363]|uniref:MFS transporter n=1 Tax=Phytomonospora sp. NPDC050363 TaxID=3155642 RepID=UPI0033E7610B